MYWTIIIPICMVIFIIYIVTGYQDFSIEQWIGSIIMGLLGLAIAWNKLEIWKLEQKSKKSKMIENQSKPNSAKPQHTTPTPTSLENNPYMPAVNAIVNRMKRLHELLPEDRSTWTDEDVLESVSRQLVQDEIQKQQSLNFSRSTLINSIPEPLPVDIDTYEEYDGSEPDWSERLLLDYDDLDEFDEQLEFGDR